jgi:eukaryotic-like serine/threonine-protein kinase
MSLSAGTKIGPYEIAAPLGKGGMGEVYRARDTRLDRNVAVKILPAEFAASSPLRLRFEREARTIASLNHPNICTLYDVGENYLVMELLEGESLAERLSRGRLPLTETMRIGAEIATALDRAHRSGVTHRDLKPGNVMLTRSGAKLLDFGLAAVGAAFMALAPEAPTAVDPITQQGMIVGTLQYMLPEQLEGQAVDCRTDIFALGCVLYEMATGKRAFEASLRTSLMAAIVTEEPRPIAELQPLTPPAFEHLVMKCLEKDREARWQSAHDIAEQLRWIASDGGQMKQGRAPRAPVAAAALALLVAAAAVGLAVMITRGKPRALPAAASLVAPPGIAEIVNAAIAPDGTRVAFTARGRDGIALWVRGIGSFDATRLDGTEGASFPFWSPDSQSIAIFTPGKLNRIAAAGGPVQYICDAPAGRGGTWGRDGTIVFAPDLLEPLSRVSAGGGTPQRITALAPDELSHRFPSFLPDGRHFVFFAAGPRTARSPKPQALWVASLDSAGRKLVERAISNAIFVEPSQLLFFADGNVVAQRLNLKTFALEGERRVIAENVDYVKGLLFANVSASPAVLLFKPSSIRPSRLVLAGRDGKPLREFTDAPYHSNEQIAPDGAHSIEFRFDPKTQDGDLFVRDLVRGGDVRLTFDTALYSGAV